MPSQGDKQLEEKLVRRVARTSVDYQLLQAGDRVMVAVSGGKDSYTLLHVLRRLSARLPFSVQLVAVHLDQRQPGYDGAGLAAWLREQGYEHEILSEDTYSVVLEHHEEGKTYCSLCSRLRRGILYTAAERLGCNKIALGHHREDTLETMLINLCYAGKLQAMPARYQTDDGRFQVIRPLIETPEAEIAAFAKTAGFPIIPCNLCGSQSVTTRKNMKRLLDELEQANPNVRSVMLNALRNVRPTHLLDPEVERAWAARPSDIPAKQEPRETERHFEARPVEFGRLRVLP